jgi:hypothetical protein
MDMPMFGMSVTPPGVLAALYGWPTIGGPQATACGGWAPYGAHELFSCFDHGLQFFITPVVSVVDWLRALGYRDISMGGLSGGGWTTVVAAALEPRIKRSFPVAGTKPIPGCRFRFRADATSIGRVAQSSRWLTTTPSTFSDPGTAFR